MNERADSENFPSKPPELKLDNKSPLIDAEKKIFYEANDEFCTKFYGGVRRDFTNDVQNVKKRSEHTDVNFFNDRLSVQNALNSYNLMRTKEPDFAWRVFARIQQIRAESANQNPVAPSEAMPQAHMTYIGTVSKAIAAIAAQRENVNEIWNTHIVSGGKTYYTSKDQDEFRKLFNSVLSDGGTITDVVGGDMASAAMKLHITITDEILENPDLTGFYDYRKIQSSPSQLPFLNFMIVNFKSRVKEVYFGWGGFGRERTGHVFMTNDDKCVQIFDRVHQALYKLGKPKEAAQPNSASVQRE